MGFLQSCTLYIGSVFFIFLGLYYPQRYRSPFILPTWALLFFSIGCLEDSWVPGLSFQLGMLCIITVLQTPIIFQQQGTPTRWSWRAAYRSYNNPRMIRPNQIDNSAKPWPYTWLVRVLRPTALYAAKPFLYTALAHLDCTWNDFSSTKESLIRSSLRGEVTTRDLLIRSIITLGWFLDTATQLEIAHSILAFIFVGILHLDATYEWPPLFASPAEAYTISRFWSRCWHQLLSPSAVAWAAAFARRSPGLRSTWRGKAFVALFVFCVSGSAHALIGWRLGDDHGPKDMLFFLVNFGAVMVERFVMELWRRRSRLVRRNHGKPGVWWRACGALWVWVFFLWLTPKVAYPKVYAELSRRFWSL